MANKRVNDDGSMKAVIYARYSSENQREESIEGQIRECYAFARKNNISVVAEYIDRAFSAKTDRRPDFQRMIKDSAKKTSILCWYGSLTVLRATVTIQRTTRQHLSATGSKSCG